MSEIKISKKEAARIERLARYARYSTALHNAYKAADAAQAGMIENMNALDCGFAWVVVHDNAFMKWCRDNCEGVGKPDTGKPRGYYGSKHWASGWSFWCPGSFHGQSVGIHEAGARAFSNSLAHELQIRCEFGSRLD